MSRTAFQSYADKVDAYVAGRPEYPLAMLAELPNVAFAIDVGAGTGISTEFVSLKADKVLAVEPVEQMAMRIPIDRLSNVEVAIASAEAVPSPDRSAGLIVCATAFHWFDYDVATAEFLRVLVPGGSLALIWNVRDRRVPWVAQFDAVLDTYAGDTPRQSTGTWRRIFGDQRFQHVVSKSYPYVKAMATGGIVDRALSTSFIAALPPDEQDVVRQRIRLIIDSEPSFVDQSRAVFPYVTELYLFRKR
jgi:ubiquinone/menaquinone biosynthesis C-methylase UbiE